MGQMGAKNLIPFPYVNTSQTINNVEFTVNGDGSISADNAASAITQFRLYGWTTGLSPLLLRKGTYILSGCPSGGGVNSLRLYLHNQDSSITIADDGEGTQFTLSDDTYVGIAIRVANGYDADGKTVYPMLRLAADTDDTYRPYAKTNRQLTEESVNKKTTVDSFYGTCDTAAATAAKVITVVDTENNFSLRPGVLVTVKFDNVNTANNPTFNVNNTGAKSVSYNNAVITTDTLWAGGDSSPSLYVYDGTNWVLLAYSSYTTAQSVVVNPTSQPTSDGSIWIETT